MWTRLGKRSVSGRRLVLSVCVGLGATAFVANAQTQPGPRRAVQAPSVRSFSTPEQAVDTLVAAAERFDVRTLEELFSLAASDVVLSGDYVQDQDRAADFAAMARKKMRISMDPNTKTRAVLLVGDDGWPFPIPLVKRASRWTFDAAAGRQELLNCRIGRNELDAIGICRGYVEAQHEYALKPREGFEVNQYAQRVISTPGTQDGLAWQQADGTWSGPVGEAIARAIAQGYSSRMQPYHGYFFKILKGQGPAAPLGEMDYVVNGVMIGGFALAAAPAEYGVTGVKTFIVSHDGVVYEKDFGKATGEQFAKMERFNPDRSWDPVTE